jgi:hypothetical protein
MISSMAETKKRTATKGKREALEEKAPKKPSAADEAIILALKELQKPPQPRARMRLRAVMRKIGLDEWKIAWLLNFKIHVLAESRKSSDNKLLLDYLKEAARHLDPASARAAAAQEAPAIELVHDVPRPDRTDPNEP